MKKLYVTLFSALFHYDSHRLLLHEMPLLFLKVLPAPLVLSI